MRCEDHGPKAAGDCKPCEGGVRNHYFSGKLLTVADYEAEQLYAIQRRRMVNREMFGWGVVSGFEISPGFGQAVAPPQTPLTIGEGFAFDERGRELAACRATRLLDEDDVVWLKKGKGDRLEPCDPPREHPAGDGHGDGGAAPADDDGAEDYNLDKDPDGDKSRPRHYLLSAHYAEQRIDGVVVDEGCGERTCHPNRICETVVFSLREVTDCPSGLPPCPKAGRPAQMLALPNHGSWDKASPGASPILAKSSDRGPHPRLVLWSIDEARDDMCGDVQFHPLGDGLKFDPDAGVPLACVEVGFACGRAVIARVGDPIRPRRLVRPNDTLFDLIRGCDLTRIQGVGWSPLLEKPDRRVPVADFFNLFTKSPAKDWIDTSMWVLFSGPVQVDSLTPHVMTITLLHPAREDHDQVFRVQIVGIKVLERLDTDPHGTTRAFRPLIDRYWWQGEVEHYGERGYESGFDKESGVEIVVHGGLIVAADGQLVAAGGGYLPGRTASPGSDFLSAFTTIPTSVPRSAASGRRVGKANTSRRSA